jgi:hypothetical protein
MINKRIKTKWLCTGLLTILLCYISIYLLLYASKDQQTARYRSIPLPSDFKYNFPQKKEELYFQTPSGGLLNALQKHTEWFVSGKVMEEH